LVQFPDAPRGLVYFIERFKRVPEAEPHAAARQFSLRGAPQRDALGFAVGHPAVANRRIHVAIGHDHALGRIGSGAENSIWGQIQAAGPLIGARVRQDCVSSRLGNARPARTG
jgi:hypothetical protein